MLVKEAIERGPIIDRLRNLLPDHFCNDSDHRRMLERKGRSVLDGAQVPSLLHEVIDILEGRGSEWTLELDGRLMDDGTVEQMLRWDPEPDIFGDNLYKGIIVKARTLTGDLIVRGNKAELVPQPVWRANREVLAEAIADAFRNPALVS